MNEPTKHAKVTTTTAREDGDLDIKTDAYYEKLARTETEIERKNVVPLQGVLKEMIDCTELLNSGAGRVELCMQLTGNGYVKITKRWLTGKQVFDKR